MSKEELHIRIKELENFIEELIDHSYMYGSDYYDRGIKLLNQNKEDET